MLPFLLLLGVGLPVVVLQQRGARPLFSDPQYVVTTLEDADPVTTPFIEVTGMSHYEGVVKQQVPGNLFRKPRTLWLFPLYEAHDTESRAVKLLVRTARQPGRLVSYEFMTVRGHLGLATGDQVPFGTEELFGRKGYYFADDLLVLEADEVVEAPVPEREVATPPRWIPGG
jgi:hypothetical protein